MYGYSEMKTNCSYSRNKAKDSRSTERGGGTWKIFIYFFCALSAVELRSYENILTTESWRKQDLFLLLFFSRGVKGVWCDCDVSKRTISLSGDLSLSFSASCEASYESGLEAEVVEPEPEASDLPAESVTLKTWKGYLTKTGNCVPGLQVPVWKMLYAH